MSILLAQVETFLQTKLQPKKKENIDSDWKEKTWSTLETKSGVKRERLIVLGVVLTVVYVLLGSVLPLLSHVVCAAYPAYESLKLVRSKSKEVQQMSNYLLYWIVFTLVTLLDFSPLSVLPFYFFFKSASLVYLYLPSTNGIEKLGQRLESFLSFFEKSFNKPEEKNE